MTVNLYGTHSRIVTSKFGRFTLLLDFILCYQKLHACSDIDSFSLSRLQQILLECKFLLIGIKTFSVLNLGLDSLDQYLLLFLGKLLWATLDL